MVPSKNKTHLDLEDGMFQTTTRLFNGSGKLTRCNYFGEPYLLTVDIYDIINAIGEWLVRTGASTSTLLVDTW